MVAPKKPKRKTFKPFVLPKEDMKHICLYAYKTHGLMAVPIARLLFSHGIPVFTPKTRKRAMAILLKNLGGAAIEICEQALDKDGKVTSLSEPFCSQASAFYRAGACSKDQRYRNDGGER